MATGFIVTCPASDDAPIYWWRIEHGAVGGRGTGDIAPDLVPDDTDPGFRVMALLPAADTSIRRMDMPDLAPRQAETAARLKTSEETLGGIGQTHVAAGHEDTLPPSVLTAAIDRSLMTARLAMLAARGIDPDVVLPIGLVLPGDPDTAFAATLGAEKVIRLGDSVIPDEDAIAALILGEHAPATLDMAARDAALAGAFAAPPLNLRSGDFAKKRAALMADPAELRRIGWLVLAVVLLSLAVPLVQLAKFSFGADAMESATLAEARGQFPDAADLPAAEAAIDARLAELGVGGNRLSVPVSALYAALQSAPNATIRDLSYSNDGLVGAVLAAPANEEINQVLGALQRQGYLVTAQPRQDAGGGSVFDVTVRAP